MKRLFFAVVLVLMTASTAMAHGRFFFGINLGFPLFYPAYPVYSYPVPSGYYHAPPRVYYEPDGSRRVVERIYVNGRLVEERVKVYEDRNGSDRYLDDYER